MRIRQGLHNVASIIGNRRSAWFKDGFYAFTTTPIFKSGNTMYYCKTPKELEV